MISLDNLLINAGYMIHQFKPRLVVRTAGGYLNYFFKQGPRLRYVDVILHYGCNLKCEHCSCETLKDSSRRQLSPEDWKRVALECEQLGSIVFGIQGGEPLIYKDLDKVIQYLNPKRNFLSIKSNGTVASDELFKKLRFAGIDSMTVGFGPIPNEYDFSDYNRVSRRLKDAFALSLKTVEALSRNGIRPMMSVVISRKNIGSSVFKGIIGIAKEYHSVLTCALAVPIGAWENHDEIMLLEEDRKALNEIMRENPHVRTDFQTTWTLDGCAALTEKLYISPYGDVLPCPFIHISFGNVLEEPLEKIWRRGVGIKTFSEYPAACIAAEDRVFLEYLKIAEKKNKKLPIRFDDPDIALLLNSTHLERQKRIS